jgi:hypothetical protein
MLSLWFFGVKNMTFLRICGLDKAICLSARAVGRQSENKLLLVIFAIAIILIAASFYYKAYLAQNPQINKDLGSRPL